MSAEVFLDTDILIYAIAREDPRASIAADLLAAGGTLSVQVLNEFTSIARGKLHRSWPEIGAALAAFRVLCPQVRLLTLATHAAALQIAQRDGFSFWDSLIVAAALEAGCTALLSEGMQHGQVIERRLAIRNPFV